MSFYLNFQKYVWMDGACFKYQIDKAVVPSGPNIMITDKKILGKQFNQFL